jgi:hypothetical protein
MALALPNAGAKQLGLGRRAVDRVSLGVPRLYRTALARVAGWNLVEQQVVLVHLAVSMARFATVDRDRVGAR